jgi:CO/xanthine dehydrogenase Mo-binding subunit
VAYEDGTLRCLSDDKKRMTFKELSEKLHATGGTIVGRASVDPPGVGGGFATHVVDVEVDPETGKVMVTRYTSFQDVGRAIHPAYVEGQMQGGVAQGIGWALNEEYIYDKAGKLDNPGFLDYRMPVCSDLPMLDNVIIEIPNPKHPQGVRGVGEVPLVPPLAAITNAVHNALGIRMNELPMSPPRVLKAMKAAKA